MTSQPHRLLVTHAVPEALAPITRLILAKLGYTILTPEEFESVAASRAGRGPDLRIVDERSLAEIPEDDGASVPIIVLTGRQGVTGVDPRIAGAVRRPAGLHELYRLLQEVLEDRPRSTPRIPVHLRATCQRDGREWGGAVLSLSENGCLLRSREPLTLGCRVELGFRLPAAGTITLDAEVAYQLVPDLGLIFTGTPPADRKAIASFVVGTLADAA